MKKLSQNWDSVEWVLTDVDDTLTCHGHLPPQTLQALQALRDAGKKVVAVTGACAGWGDHIAQLWPVDAVLAENGAVIMEKKDGYLVRHGLTDMAELARKQGQLKAQIGEILKSYPGLEFTLDQAYRVCEVAIDIGQNRPAVDPNIVEQVVNDIHQLGANATASSIHINAWYGEHSKRITAEYFLKQQGLSDEQILTQCCYVGDSPNDVAMFAWLPNSIGVANIEKYWDKLTHKPAIVMSKPGGYGFAEFAELLLAHLNAKS
ncbi:HAD family hydrolase [Vibrio sp. WXL103]|uniref:HAD family hydrolase n=1 Tax=Vibrio sp. WXL103 TaxID=3450710 RepID=UPI003EC6089F